MSDQRDLGLRKLSRKASAALLRVRTGEALRRVALLLPIPLVYAVGALTAIKVLHPSAQTTRVLVIVAIALAVAVVGVGVFVFFRKRSRVLGAQLLDQYHGLSDRVSSALYFSTFQPSEQTAMVRAAIDDGIKVADVLRPRKAVPISLPKDLLVSVALGAMVVLIAQFEVRSKQIVPHVVDTFQPMAMNPDDVELLREMAERLKVDSQDPEVMAAVRRFNQLVEDIAERRVDRRQVFERLEELERSILKGDAAEQEAMDEGLEGLARALKTSPLSKPIAEALEQKQLKDAEEAMRKLAERLKNKKDVNRAQLEQLRQAMQTASKSSMERLERLEQRRRELEDERRRLLKKKQDEKKPNRELDKNLERNKRKLERLSREKNRAANARKKLSQLDKDLAKAAADLMKDMGKSAESLQQGAEDLNRMAQKEMTQKEKEALLKRLKELRDLMRQQGKGGQGRMQRLVRFGERARGGQGQGQGQGKDGKGAKAKPMLTLGQGSGKGVSLPMPGGPGAGQSGGQTQAGQQGGDPGGKEWGTGQGGEIKGDKSELKGETQDVSAAGIDTGEGPSASEVVYGAAERGFVGRGYREVYTDYQTVAEQVIERDEIPPGYRFYVRRYFQLIRPRD